MDLIKLTIDNGVLDCSGPSTECVRVKYGTWAKVMAIAPISNLECYYLIQNTDSSDGSPVIKMMKVNLDTGGSKVESEQLLPYSMYTLETLYYNQLNMVSFTVYDKNNVFKDFYVSAVLDYLPEGDDSMNDGEYGNLAAVLKLNQNRISSFFGSY